MTQKSYPKNLGTQNGDISILGLQIGILFPFSPIPFTHTKMPESLDIEPKNGALRKQK